MWPIRWPQGCFFNFWFFMNICWKELLRLKSLEFCGCYKVFYLQSRIKILTFRVHDGGQIWTTPLQQCENLHISIWKRHYYVKVHFAKKLKVDLLLSYVRWSSAWALNSAAADIQPGFGFTLVDTVAIEALSTARWTVVMSVLWVSINTESPQCDHDKTCMIS